MKKYLFLAILSILGMAYYFGDLPAKCKNKTHVNECCPGKKTYDCYRKKSTLMLGKENKSDKSVKCDYCGCPASDHNDD